MRARTALELAGRGALRPPACGARLLCAAARPPIRDLAERAAASAAGAREVAHWCEALAKAQPSPFLPLHVPRQKRAGGAEAEDAAVTRPPRSWFRRPLDKATVAYASERGRAMLGDVVGDERGGAAFLDVMSAFDMQRHPVSCGVASLTIALNVLRLAPWRAGTRAAVPGGSALDGEDEEEFDMVTEDEIVKALFREGERKSLDAAGVSLQTLADVALRVDGIHVECRYAQSGGSAGGFSEAEFRQAIERVTSDQCLAQGRGREVMLVNFSRPSLGQTGSGHFSPIAAWHPETDMALVLDTARFKYPAFWAPVNKLFQSLATLDDDTQLSRGFLLLSKPP